MAADDDEHATTAFQVLLKHSSSGSRDLSSDEEDLSYQVVDEEDLSPDEDIDEEALSSNEEAEEIMSSDEEIRSSDTDALASDDEDITHDANPNRNCLNYNGSSNCSNRVSCKEADLSHYLMICKVCPDTYYCKPCVELIKNGKLPIRLCPPEHGFLEIPGPGWWPPRVRYVIYRGEEVERKEWLDLVRVKYELEM